MLMVYDLACRYSQNEIFQTTDRLKYRPLEIIPKQKQCHFEKENSMLSVSNYDP